eukprot:12191258-Heterocapsa_arctica.AAC.1
MGQRIRIPSAFQGLTKKQARTSNILEGDFATTEDGIRKLRHISATKKPEEENTLKVDDRMPPMSRTRSVRLKTILMDSLVLKK